MKKATVTLNTNEPTFYAIAAKAWQQCAANRNAFVSFNSIYTTEYITAAEVALKAAKEIPNKEARQAIQLRMKAVLEQKTGVCNGMIQNLFVIIARSFPKNEVESMRRQAGSGYYKSATENENRNSADSLYSMASAFLVTYKEDLQKGNIPSNFEDIFTASRQDFNQAFINYKEARDNVSKGSTIKNAALAAVYNSLMVLLADGKAIFRHQPAQRKYFNYRELKKIVAGAGKTGIRFSLKQEVTEQPAANASVTMQPGNHTFSPDKKGIIKEVMPAGTYTYTITTPGMKTIEGYIKINAGSTRQVKIILQHAEPVQSIESQQFSTITQEQANKKAS